MLSERSRSVLYQRFMTVVGDERAVQEMMSYFPARDVEEPVTRDYLHAEMAGLRTELAVFRADMRGEMDAFRTEIRGEMESFRTEIRGEMDAFRAEVRGEMGAFRREVTGEIHRMLAWNLAAFVSMAAVIVAAVRL